MPEHCDRLIEEAALFIPSYECNSPVAGSDFDRLIWGYRRTQTALLGDPYCHKKARLILNRAIRKSD